MTPKRTGLSLIGTSLLELVSIVAGAALGAILAQLLTSSALIASIPLFVIPAVSLALYFFRRSSNHFHRLEKLERFLHWFDGGISGSFIGLLIAGATGLFVISPQVAILAAVIFLVGIGSVVVVVNFPQFVRKAVIDEQLLGWRSSNLRALRGDFTSIKVVGEESDLPRGIKDQDLVIYCKKTGSEILTCDRKLYANFFTDGAESVKIRVYGINNEKSRQTIYSVQITS